MKSLKPSMKENKRYLLVEGKELRKNINDLYRYEFIGKTKKEDGSLGFFLTEKGKWRALNYKLENIKNPVLSKLKINEELGEFVQSYIIHKKMCRPEKYLSDEESKREMAKELSDILGLVFVIAKTFDIDIEEAITKDSIIVALLRGGIILGKIISDCYNLPLKPLAVKKIGAPSNQELAIGAITADRTIYLDRNLIENLGAEDKYLKEMSEIKVKEAQTLQRIFKSEISLKNKKVMIIDDGVATGATAICASIYAQKQNAKEIILATPVISKDRINDIKKYFDRVISLKIANNLASVGEFYKYFPQVEDKDVFGILNSKNQK